MRQLAAFPGTGLILIILWDAFETVILPRRVKRRFRLSTTFYKSIWKPWSGLLRYVSNRKKQEKYLGVFGPLSLLLLGAMWAAGLVFGYALLLWAIHAPLNGAANTTFGSYIYLSGVTFFTLGYGDVTPALLWGRALVIIEAANGFGLLAIVIGYLPVLYQSFARREVSIALLDARAGSPPSAAEMLRRYGAAEGLDHLDVVLHEWENWSAELLESHLSYPALCFFRSQHDNQSWLASMTTILDACSLVLVGIEGMPKWQAQLTFAMARHAVVDIAQNSETAPIKPEFLPCRLKPGDLERIREILAKNGTNLKDGEESEQKLAELRAMYEPYVCALSEMLLMPLPAWILGEDAIDNWKTSAWGRIQ